MGLPAFKAYDIRGRLPDELNEELAWRIGRAYARFLAPQRVAIGRDVRLSSQSLATALCRGLTESGVDVLDLGLCGTEEVYFAAFDAPVDGGIMVTASHNPLDYNGMKLVRAGARPISGDSGLREIETLAAIGAVAVPDGPAGRIKVDTDKRRYIEHLLGYVDTTVLRPFKVVVNAGNGCAGPIVDLLAPYLPVEFICVRHEPDGTFPYGIPNPLLPENRAATTEAVQRHGADLGIAWDGDFDRCFLFDERGEFIEGYYIVGLLAEALLQRHPGARIIHDPRLTWNTLEMVETAGGVPVMSKTGHAFIKERMRAEDAVYGGEMSAHHYFREFAYCDSGMIPWLLVLELMARRNRPLSALLGERMRRFPASGEINRRLDDPAAALRRVYTRFSKEALQEDRTDGLSLEFAAWRFNLRSSNTEPVLRLNVESRGDERLMREKTREILLCLDAQ
ncbi:MAG: phosphomannomutase [Desulfuromonadales bacterium]|nr:phosphomannomutase [Desulfuromonadales bacterium]